MLPSNERQIREQAKFAYYPLGKAFKKQTEKQICALKSLDLSNKKDELKINEGIFPQNLVNNLICVELKEIVKFQDDLKCKSKCGKTYNFGNIHCILFLRDIKNGYLSLEKADDNQSNFANEKGTKTLVKKISSF